MTKNDKEYQKKASRKHYLANKEVVKERSILKRHLMREYVIEIKNSTPCADCNNKYPYYIMDFDHQPGCDKIIEVSRLINYGSWDRLKNEISKCDVVCSNCHRERTHTRLSSSIG